MIGSMYNSNKLISTFMFTVYLREFETSLTIRLRIFAQLDSVHLTRSFIRFMWFKSAAPAALLASAFAYGVANKNAIINDADVKTEKAERRLSLEAKKEKARETIVRQMVTLQYKLNMYSSTRALELLWKHSI